MRTRHVAAGKIDAGEEALQLTLLELVQAVGEVTSSDAETVAAVRYLLATRRVRLCGNFRGAPVRIFS